ncbi:MAG TPA: hypothetical protein VH084_22980 [Mycobacterium sp.]|nr:hypothetical protein [Mycobacterium sp.]
MADDADRLPGGDEATHELDHVVVAGKLVGFHHPGHHEQRLVLVDSRFSHRLVDGIRAARIEVSIERFDLPGSQ